MFAGPNAGPSLEAGSGAASSAVLKRFFERAGPRSVWLRLEQGTLESRVAIQSSLRPAAPGLRLNLPDAIALPERVCKGTGPNDGLVLHRNSESP
jgi:hypothetical protein